MSFRDFFRVDKSSASSATLQQQQLLSSSYENDPPPPTALIAVPIKSSMKKGGGGRSRSYNNNKTSTTTTPEVLRNGAPTTTPSPYYSPTGGGHYYQHPSIMTTPVGAAAASPLYPASSLMRTGRVSSLPMSGPTSPLHASPQPKTKTKSGGGKSANASSGGSVLVLHGKVHNYISDSSSVSMASSTNSSEDSLEKVMGHVANTNTGAKQPHPGQFQQPPIAVPASRSRSLPNTAATTNYYPPIPLHVASTPSSMSNHPHGRGTMGVAPTSVTALTPTSVAAVSSTLQQLAFELQQFQSLIGDLQGMMLMLGQQQQDTNMSIPEAGWRTRILVRSAQEADNDLWRKLFEAEQTVLAMKNEADMAHDNDDDQINASTKQHRKLAVQEAQAKCLELHRHFKHLHKTLLCTLEAHEHSQRAAVAQQLHTAAVLMMNPATTTTTAAGAASPSVLSTPTRGSVLPVAAMYSPHAAGAMSPPLSPMPYGMMASPPLSPSMSHTAFSAPSLAGSAMMSMNSPLGPPPPAAMDYFDRVTHQAEMERSGAFGAPYGGGNQTFATSGAPTATTAGEAADANAAAAASKEDRPPSLWASQHCTEDGPMSAWGQYVNQAAPGLCGSLETLGDPRLWNFGGIEALDLVYKGSDMELSKGSAADRPPPAKQQNSSDKDVDHDSVEMISPASEAIEVERILTEEKDAVVGVNTSSSSGGFVSRVPSIVKSFTDASMGTALPSVPTGPCGQGGVCSDAGSMGDGKLLGCIGKPLDQDEEGEGGEGTNRALNCGALQGVYLDQIQRNLVQFGRNVMSSVAEGARGDEKNPAAARGGDGTRTHRRGNKHQDDYDGDDDHEDDEEEDDDDEDDEYDEMIEA